MSAIQTILYPTDFSKHAEYAFPLACSLARDYGARLVILHAVAPPIMFGEGVAVPPPVDDKQALQEKLNQLQAPDSRISVERRLLDGDPASEILHVAAETKCGMIVMGTHGRTGLGRLLMGSVAEQVVRKAPCPVLTMRIPLPETQSARPCAETGSTPVAVGKG
jgi:nucleotide-binding universal stress UspA family protein